MMIDVYCSLIILSEYYYVTILDKVQRLQRTRTTDDTISHDFTICITL